MPTMIGEHKDHSFTVFMDDHASSATTFDAGLRLKQRPGAVAKSKRRHDENDVVDDKDEEEEYDEENLNKLCSFC